MKELLEPPMIINNSLRQLFLIKPSLHQPEIKSFMAEIENIIMPYLTMVVYKEKCGSKRNSKIWIVVVALNLLD